MSNLKHSLLCLASTRLPGPSLARPFTTEEGSPLHELCCWNAIKTARYDTLYNVFVLTIRRVVCTHAVPLWLRLPVVLAHVSNNYEYSHSPGFLGKDNSSNGGAPDPSSVAKVRRRETSLVLVGASTHIWCAIRKWAWP